MKVCLFGGTFDPPHVGHLIIAETIKEAEKFDRVIFIPAFMPPHKEQSGLSAIEDRLEMLRRSLSGNDNLELSKVEVKRGGISYTVETIRKLKSRYNVQKQDICFLMGSDSLLEFHNWKRPDQILEECRVLVAVRPGFRPSRVAPRLLSRIRFANVPRIEISSSQIRRRVSRGLTIRYMVPDSVREYIEEKGLYK